MTYSFTQISQYLQCPRKYRYRYLDGWRESFEVFKSAARKGFSRSAQHAGEAEQSFFIHFVAAEQVGVVSEIPKKPVQFPERLLGAVDSPRNFA